MTSTKRWRPWTRCDNFSTARIQCIQKFDEVCKWSVCCLFLKVWKMWGQLPHWRRTSWAAEATISISTRLWDALGMFVRSTLFLWCLNLCSQWLCVVHGIVPAGKLDDRIRNQDMYMDMSKSKWHRAFWCFLLLLIFYNIHIACFAAASEQGFRFEELTLTDWWSSYPPLPSKEGMYHGKDWSRLAKEDLAAWQDP